MLSTRSHTDILTEVQDQNLIGLLEDHYSQYRHIKLELVLQRLIEFSCSIADKAEQKNFKDRFTALLVELIDIKSIKNKGERNVAYLNVLGAFKICLSDYI